MAEKKSLKDEFEKLNRELSEIDIEENFDAYKAKADELGKVGAKYFNERVTIKLPRARADEEKFYVVVWNGTKYSIERNREVSVPRGVAEIIRNAEDQEDYAYELMEELKDEFNPEAKQLNF